MINNFKRLEHVASAAGMMPHHVENQVLVKSLKVNQIPECAAAANLIAFN